jgi:hypothetical protein
MDQITLSAKNFGAVASKDFCKRCFYLKLKTNFKLPFQSFPGIFSSLDSYQKKCVENMIALNHSGYLSEKKIVKSHKVPHWSKFSKEYPEYGIILRGSPDAILEFEDKTFMIPDFKTSRITDNTDDFAPIYHIQLNVYKEIAESYSFDPVSDLSLIYFEPVTDDISAKDKWTLQGYKMDFMATKIPVAVNHDLIVECLKKVREIYDMPQAPEGNNKCKDCAAVDSLINYSVDKKEQVL